MANPDALYSSPDFEAYTTLAALETAFTSGARKGQLTRRIVCMSGGTLKLRPGVSGASTIDWVFDAGVPEDIQAGAFTAAGSTVAPSASLPIKVYY